MYDTILSVYEITDEGEVLVDSWTSRWKEVHNFGLKLSCGKSYILREDKATGGYHKIPGDILFNVTADGKIQITEGQDWKYENGKNVIEEVVDEAGNVIYLIRDVRNPEEEEETTVSETPTTTPSSERVILGIEDMSRTIGMALAGFGAIMLTALIWLYLRSKKA